MRNQRVTASPNTRAGAGRWDSRAKGRKKGRSAKGAGRKAGKAARQAASDVQANGVRPSWNPRPDGAPVAVVASPFGPYRRVITAVVPAALAGEAAKAKRALAREERLTEEERDAVRAYAVVRAVIEDAVGRAGRCWRRVLNPAELRQLAGGVGSMPPVVHDRNDWASWLPRPAAPIPLSTREWKLLDEVWRWIMWLSIQPRRIVWARMMGVAWQEIRTNDPDRRSRQMLARVWNEALDQIVRAWIRENTKSLKEGLHRIQDLA